MPSASKIYSSLPPLLRYSLVNSRALASMTWKLSWNATRERRLLLFTSVMGSDSHGDER